MAGPLSGIRIIELAGIGPAPFAGMMLADHGAEVIRIERPGARLDAKDPLLRSRRVVALDLKSAEGKAAVLDLAKTAHGLIEGFRPGVIERMGLGPDVLHAANPALVVGRMTGWGQFGPYSQAAGHDINYIALAGALHGYGRAGEKPTPPINMVGDFGGGGMMLAFGMVSALLHAQKTGEGQVIDCAMTDGAATLMSMIWGFRANGIWRNERGVNLLDTGAHMYDTYETSDGKWISIGSLEPQFYAELRVRAGLKDDPDFDAQMDSRQWPVLKAKLTALFLTKTRDEWCALMEMTDVCFAPVLSMAEAPRHPHNAARQTFIEVDGVMQPAPAPRYSRTVTDLPFMTTKWDDQLKGSGG
ncbi:alpha-methylacyl-CoA racemase [Polymorphobacter multimanifer]|uniref:Alpha-methylacyl-CoA racemase n=1 Tax=Polymorphobacter multimanifer TaxID=1070431 RepID=A0A841L7S1_9SPHN|nr:CaiB/BaiF CoA-transferase family protein [Polymorphobacter multimanifer]MBB6228657.1 alpha-methylacyl-CoA racemase [Polymorphobacter multimanifer]GGI91244.1 alpha-methylacyl-CoA racemase [Polymorphobacter multimanifer]